MTLMYLPANSNIIYAGDFNIYTSSEPMWGVLTGATGGGSNHADTTGVDPIHQVGSWDNSTKFQCRRYPKPFPSSHCHPAQQQGFVGSSGGMDDRFDFQLSTSYRPGRPTASPTSQIPTKPSKTTGPPCSIASSTIQCNTASSPTVLKDMATFLDHLPVVADYQLPAKQSVTV